MIVPGRRLAALLSKPFKKGNLYFILSIIYGKIIRFILTYSLPDTAMTGFFYSLFLLPEYLKYSYYLNFQKEF
jgi:hypothetical protein